MKFAWKALYTMDVCQSLEIDAWHRVEDRRNEGKQAVQMEGVVHETSTWKMVMLWTQFTIAQLQKE